jgi:hypothetical protein
MRTLESVPLALAMLLLASCKTDAVRDDVPARIINPSPASLAEIRDTVSRALGGREVRIAPDALTTDSLLIIEPAHLMGRDLRKPDHFRLVLNGSACILVHEESSRRYELGNTRCRAEGS